ncbi:MAG: recombinase family protein, partial [Planctomyces sp.]
MEHPRSPSPDSNQPADGNAETEGSQECLRKTAFSLFSNLSQFDRLPQKSQKNLEFVASGSSCGAVARELNRRGHRTMFGKRFNATSVRRTIRNVTYAGDVASGNRRRRGRFRSLHDKGGAVCQNAHEPLVSRALFDKVQRRLQADQNTARSSTPGKYLLTGLIYLADNGQRMQGFTMSHSNRKVVRRYYGPPPRLFEEFPDDSDRPTFRADTIEQAVLEKLREFLSVERNKRAIRTEIDRRTKKAAVETDRIESPLAEIRAKIERAT